MTPRKVTSAESPIEIDVVAGLPVPGALGLTFCPGKCDVKWERDLDADLDVIARWASTVVTLIEPHEFEYLRVPGLGAGIERRGLRWLHLPIVDMSTPDERFRHAWPAALETILADLRGAKNVVVHCYGGLGRAGTVSALIAIELGLSPKEAIAAVRSARPGTIQTLAQERYVLDYRAITP